MGNYRQYNYKMAASEDIETKVEEPKVIEKTVNCALLNVRKEPDGEVLNIVSKGAVLKIVEEVDKWSKLEDGTYVMSRFLD